MGAAEASASASVRFNADDALCQHDARQSAQLKTTGTPIGGNDLWIGCHALALNAMLVSNHTREFDRITGLRLANCAA